MSTNEPTETHHSYCECDECDLRRYLAERCASHDCKRLTPGIACLNARHSKSKGLCATCFNHGCVANAEPSTPSANLIAGNVASAKVPVTHEAQLLAAARRTPNMQNALDSFDALYEAWCGLLGLPEMDRNVFVARVTANWSRYSIAGITLDHIVLASIVCAAAHLDLTMEQIRDLRVRIAAINVKLIAIAVRERAK